MSLDLFTEVYKKSTDLLKTQALDKRWSNIETKMKCLLGADGPDSTQADVLELVRTSLQSAAKGNGADGVANEILSLARSNTAGFQDRAALIKLFKHSYFLSIKGNQDCWVVDHPTDFAKWCYDELDSKTADQLKPLLKKEDETFGAQRRKIMSDSLQLARKWANDILVKLGTPDAKTLASVKRWFHADADSEEDVKKTVVVLLDGFKKIAAVCNANTVIFSDRPHKRTSGTYDTTFASVNKGDKMPVIYMFPHFFKEAGIDNLGQVGKMWLCALTIIHELSHKFAGTNDNSYDVLGLKPGGRNLTVANAIKTADSWGYFAADISGALPATALTAYYK